MEHSGLEMRMELKDTFSRMLLQTNPVTLSCPAGYQSPGTLSATCKAYPANASATTDYYTYTCFPCPLGTYKESAGAGLCTACAGGKTTPSIGTTNSTLCTFCPAGTYTVNTWVTGPVTGAGSISCSPCPAGYYSDGTASISSCVVCTGGEAREVYCLLCGQTMSSTRAHTICI